MDKNLEEMANRINYDDLVVKPKAFLGALRNLGYTAYEAIPEFVDNSIDGSARNIRIVVDPNREDPKKPVVSRIITVDDGVGMDNERLHDCMGLGSDGCHESDSELGYYGLGLKTAALAMGRRLTVMTKTDDCDDIHCACMDLDDFVVDGCKVGFYDITNKQSDEYKEFINNVSFGSDEASYHGTIVLVDKIDKVETLYYGFVKQLERELRIIYNQFIYSELVEIFVNDEKLTFFDIIGDKSGLNIDVMESGQFEYGEGQQKAKIRYYTYYIHLEDSQTDRGGERFPNHYGRAQSTCGIYIYRNNRLVGRARDLGIINKPNNYYNGFKCILFLEGMDCDRLFKSTFSKTIKEECKKNMEQGFVDKLKGVIGPLKEDARRRQKNDSDKIPQDQIDADVKNRLERITDNINSNLIIKRDLANSTFGANKKHADSKPQEKKERKKQEHPNPTKRRTEKVIGGFKFENMDINDPLACVDMKNNRPYVVFNTTHPFIRKICSSNNPELQEMFARYFFAEYYAKKQTNYYSDDEERSIIDEYTRQISSGTRKSLDESI